MLLRRAMHTRADFHCLPSDGACDCLGLLGDLEVSALVPELKTCTSWDVCQGQAGFMSTVLLGSGV